MTPITCTSRYRFTGVIPNKTNMIIVSNYELVEKTPGVFLFGVQNRFPVPVAVAS